MMPGSRLGSSSVEYALVAAMLIVGLGPMANVVGPKVRAFHKARAERLGYRYSPTWSNVTVETHSVRREVTSRTAEGAITTVTGGGGKPSTILQTRTDDFSNQPANTEKVF